MKKKAISIEELVRRQKEVEDEGIEGKFGEDELLARTLDPTTGQHDLYLINISDGYIKKKISNCGLACWFKDDSLIFCHLFGKTIYKFDLREGQTSKLIDTPHTIGHLYFRKKTDRIYITLYDNVGESILYSVHTDGSKVKPITSVNNMFRRIHFTPDDKKALIERTGSVFIPSAKATSYTPFFFMVDLNSKKEQKFKHDDTRERIDEIALSPTLDILVYSGQERSHAYQYRLVFTNHKGKSFGNKIYETTVIKNPTWSPNGEWLAYISQGLNLVNVKTKKKKKIGFMASLNYKSMAWSLDNNWIVYNVEDKMNKEVRLYMTSITSDETRKLASGHFYNLQFKPK